MTKKLINLGIYIVIFGIRLSMYLYVHFFSRDVSAIHFDPTKEDHKQFEMELLKKKEKVVKKNKLVK